MKLDFYIIEDDLSIVRIIENIISEHGLGTVIGNSCFSQDIIDEVYDMKPDILLVDFLLPEEDGLELIDRIKKMGFKGKFIIISEVTAKSVIGEAYKIGVEYFINKPVNVIEVVKVIEKVTSTIKAERMIELLGIDYKSISIKKDRETTKALNQVYMDLGIMGQSGIEELTDIVMMLFERKKNNLSFNYKMNDIYNYVVKECSEKGITTNIKAVEQRLRRLAITAMENIAAMGLEDFGNYKFEKYSTSLFNYKDVRMEMDYMRGKSKYHGRIGIKKFIEGIMSITRK